PPVPVPPVPGGDPLHDGDLQLALFACYELHYQGFDDVDERWEGEPSLLGVRAGLERHFEEALAAAVPRPRPVAPGQVRRALAARRGAGAGPLPRRRQPRRPLDQFRASVVRRSMHHLKEADPHTWAIPGLGGRAKAALGEIQADEYGGGRRERMHSELFRAT